MYVVTLTQKIDPSLFYTVTRTYNGMGLPISVSAGGTTTQYQYVYEGGLRVDKVSTPYASGETYYWAKTAYDTLGRPSTVTAPDTTVTNYAYDGLKVTVTDANSNATSTTTDILGRTVFVDAPTGPDITFDYDDLGNPISALRGGAETTMQYDLGGRKTSMNDPDMGAWTYNYDALGNLLRQRDAKNQVACLYYDSLNRPKGKNYFTNDAACPPDPGTTHYAVENLYDGGQYGIGNRTGMTDGSGSTSWNHDVRGRLVSESKTISGGGSPFTTEWTYNSADLPITMTYPDGEEVTYYYNERVLLESVAGATNYVFDTQYDSAGRATSREIGSGLVQKFVYKPWNVEGGRLDAIVSGSGTWNESTLLFADTLQKLSYDYDDIGNITQIEQVVNFGTNEIESQAFTYDSLNRLKSWTLTGSPTKNYDYDAAGNLWHKEDMTLAYNDANHVHAVTDANGNSYDYDDNGNMTRREIISGPEAGTYDLIYDADNRLVEVKKNDTTIALFTFDGDGLRVKSIVDGETILFVGGYYQKKGTEITKYYPGGAMRKYVIPQSMSVEYILGDHLGSATVMTDSLGNKVSEMRYSPWGEVRYSWVDPNLSTTPTYTLPKQTFTGQYSYIDDPSTQSTEGFGLMFYNARWYDPTLGRFAQADAIVPGGLQSLDRYSYVSNNPVIYTDPSGHAQYRNGYQQQIHDKKMGLIPAPASYAESRRGQCDSFLSDGTCLNADYYLAEFGIVTQGLSEDQKWEVVLAALYSGSKFTNYFSGTSGDAFKAAHGKIIVKRGKGDWKGNCQTIDNTITCKSDASWYTYLHEFGHVFDNYWTDKTGNWAADLDPFTYHGKPIDSCEGYWCRSSAGFKCDGKWGCMEHPYNEKEFAGESRTDGFAKQEQFADLYLNWVLDGIGDVNHGFTSDVDGNARRLYMAQQFYWIFNGGSHCSSPVFLTCVGP